MHGILEQVTIAQRLNTGSNIFTVCISFQYNRGGGGFGVHTKYSSLLRRDYSGLPVLPSTTIIVSPWIEASPLTQ